MLQTFPIIKENAMFIADSHFYPNDKRGFELFDTLLENPPPQVFLMGDIFHLLIGHIPSSLKYNQALLVKINTLSQKTEVFYFEGNHDFALPSSLLPQVRIYPRVLQPALFLFDDKKILLAHGDLFITPLYDFYINMMNNPVVLSLFKLVDLCSFGKFYARIHKKIIKKPVLPLKNMEFFLEKRLENYENFAKKHHFCFDIILEGHFHTTLKSQKYWAIPSFYCQKQTLRITKKIFYSLI